MANTLYVGNLPFKISDDDLKAHFTSAGKVTGVSHVRDRASGRSNGCAFIEMTDDRGASHAIDALNESKLGGRTITVALARPS